MKSMRHSLYFIISTLLAVSALAKTPDYDKDIYPLLEKYCYDCHSDGIDKAEIALDKLEDASTHNPENPNWERIWIAIEDQQMPPQNKKLPSEEERELILRWIENRVFNHNCSNPDPGRVTIRRLNRTEYGNTIRDLFGLRKDFRPEDKFPVDDSGYGFDNIGDVLTVPPVLLEKYLTAADETLNEALRLGPPTLPIRHIPSKNFKGYGSQREDVRAYPSSGISYTHVDIRRSGKYKIRIKAMADQGGDEKAKADIQINDKSIGQITIPESRPATTTGEIEVQLNRGTRKISVNLYKDFYDPQNPDPKKRDRNLYLYWLEVEGPTNLPPPAAPESHRKLFTVKPSKELPPVEAARKILSPFASKAYRRPVQKAELEKLLLLFQRAQQDKLSFEESIALSIKAILISPKFLFRGEVQPDPDNPNSIHLIDEFALASRLSYFLWSSMPDEELFTLAWEGKLRDNLNKQVYRMLEDPRSEALANNFAGQWLELRNLNNVMPDTNRFKSFNRQISQDMRKETQLFFNHIFREDRSVLEFLNADYSFLNQRLAQYYGINDVLGGEFRKVSLKKTNRGGVLTQGSILTVTSNPTRTSPVKRGKWVLENLLGLPPPPPDPNAPPLPEDDKAFEDATLREIMEKHRADPGCAACHIKMDSIGLALENFDPVGTWRTTYGKTPVDASGEFTNGTKFIGPQELNKVLVRDFKKEYLSHLTETLLTYALGRGPEYYDRCTVQDIVTELEANNYTFSTLIYGIINSTPFQKRRGDSAGKE